ncbi:NADH-quinone oxidoreductase subunit N [Arcanobacterium pluranimalium]|uniref:NADH-quinone oxidoreductase subunit NuoN n=1 Tax=Arcanobacterium pluranimalium TaxID=108028 RepID=UPI00195D1E75|nr:NADH-quinone oxidoreductase subunit N [Arcanobacterium pluranimalium]
MTTTVIQWVAVLPLLIVLGTAVFSTLLEAFLPRNIRRGTQVVLTLVALAAALVSVVWRWTEIHTDNGLATNPLSAVQTQRGFVGISLVEDGFSLIGQGIILIASILAFLVIADRTQTREGAFAASAATRPGSAQERESAAAGREQSEIFPLALFAVGGMMAFTSAFDLLTLFIALEVLSLPLYVLCATARRRRLLSQEAAMKYFLLGAFSSAIFLMGAAFIYGSTGTLVFNEILQLAIQGQRVQGAILVMGVAMVVIGLLFKVGAAPFHSWTPDVYQGAPTPITGFMAAGTKAAAFIALLRVMLYVAATASASLNVFMWIVIIATIIVGTVLGLIQSDIKRLLAYSSIAHAGFILIAVNAIRTVNMTPQTYSQTMSSVLFYLLAYGIATVGAFAIVTLVRERDTEGKILGEATKLEKWAGLGKRSPFLAASMLIFLLSFAGIPLTGGFIGKFEVFRAGIASGEVILVVIAVLASAATAFFYFRLVQLMFFTEPADDVEVVQSEGMAIIAIAIAVVLTIALGLLPGSVLDLMQGSFA